MKVYMVDAFTYQGKGGNPAGVCLEAEGLKAADMLAIAAEVGASETAFVLPAEQADFQVRFFTPVEEVPLCGHATVATFSQLFQSGNVKPGVRTQLTGAGVLSVEVLEDGQIWMDQSLPEYDEVLSVSDILESLQLTEEDLAEGFEPAIVTTGLRDIFMPVKSQAVLSKLRPDFARITEISKANRVSGYHVFTLDAPEGFTASCRNFAPYYDIEEESATGTSSGALAAYLHQYAKINGPYRFLQGADMGLPSAIEASLEVMDGHIGRVRVGGKATVKEIRELTVV